MRYVLALLSFLVFTTPVFSDSQFCAGFALGYKTIKGNMVLVPLCPLEPLTPLGSTPFQEGLKAGMLAASE